MIPDTPKYCKDCRYYAEILSAIVGCRHICTVLEDTPCLVTGPSRKRIDAYKMRKAPGWFTRSPRCGPEGKFFEPRPPEVPRDIRYFPY